MDLALRRCFVSRTPWRGSRKTFAPGHAAFEARAGTNSLPTAPFRRKRLVISPDAISPDAMTKKMASRGVGKCPEILAYLSRLTRLAI
jgi:hypothetical protein